MNILSLIYWCYSLGFEHEINNLLDKFVQAVKTGDVNQLENYLVYTLDHIINSLGPEIWNRYFTLLFTLFGKRDNRR